MTAKAKYPFNLTVPFGGFTFRHPKTGATVLEYTPNKKQYLAHNCCADEVFIGGATFGGKSFFILMHNAMHCITYGADANTILFRRTYPELEKTLIQEQKRYFDGVLGNYKASEYVFEWYNGARTHFAHMETRDDIQKYQGGGYTLMGWDELTRFEEDMYTTLFAWVRSHQGGKRVQCQVIAASNPGGVGHRWVFERFIAHADAYKEQVIHTPAMEIGGVTVPENVTTRIFIPAWATDNEEGMKRNPSYLPRLREGMSEDRFRALVEGRWDLFEGMAFPEWDADRHVCDPFPIPGSWKVIRTIDWGYRTPFDIGWVAQDPDTKHIYLIDEVYGHKMGSGGAVHGAEMPPTEVRRQIENHERAALVSGAYPKVRYGVGDPSMWSTRGGESKVGDLLNDGSVLFLSGNHDRLLRAQIYHTLLRDDPLTGEPRFKVFSSCKHFIRTFPQLQQSEKTQDDVDTEGEDHPYDSVGYGLVDLFQKPAAVTSLAATRTLERRYRAPALV